MYKGIESITKSLNQMANVTAGLYRDTFMNGIQTSMTSATQVMNASLAQAIKPIVCDGISEAVANMGKIIQPALSEQILQSIQPSLITATQTLADTMVQTLSPQLYMGVGEALENIGKILQPTYLNMMNGICSDVCAGALSEIANNISVLTKGIPNISDTVSDAVKSIDWSSLTFNEQSNCIEYGGRTYTTEDIEKEAVLCNEEIESVADKSVLRQIFNKYTIIRILVALLLNVVLYPTLSTGVTTAWEENKFYLASALSQAEQIGYIVADEVSVRVSNSSHSSEICKLLYGDGIVITDSIPYWYKVKLKDVDGNPVEGYVAKKHIDYKILKFF